MTAPVSPVSDDLPTDESATPAAPAYVVPDRADAPVSEVTERFLRAIIAQVPADRIEELHLFSPLRQGTVETGIAVLATRVEVPVEAIVEEQEKVDENAPAFLLDHEAIEIDTDVDTDVDADVDAAVDVTVNVDVDASVDAEVDAAVDAEVDAEIVVEAEDVVITTIESPYLDGDATDVAMESVALTDEGVEMMIDAPPVRAVRHTVYTARYRYVIKGPERGKWEASVKAEAEAPLITVETVVRGVQRRAGEETEIVRFNGAQIARALRLPTA